MPPIYLDFNATTPVSHEAAEAMRPYLEERFGNPSSSHWYGVQTKQAIVAARGQLAGLLGCAPEEIVFTSGGSESNNLAIKGAVFASRARGNHIVTSAVEHPAVSEVCAWLARNGFRVTTLPVNGEGRVSPADLEAALTPETVLVSVMHANNEVGTIQPIAELAAIARGRGALFHTDAAQSVGKIPVRVDDLGVDLLSVAGHKFYGPKGIGALYIRRGVSVDKLIHGADHEANMRAGTENILEIVGLGAAAAAATRDLDGNSAHMRTLRDRLEEGLLAAVPDARVNGDRKHRLPNTLSISFPLVEANTLLDEIGEDVAASAGAACHTDSIDVSVVLEAMKVPVEYAMGTIRFTTGRSTTAAEIDAAIETVTAAVARLRPDGAPACVPGAATEEVKLTRFTHGLGCACKLRPQDLEKVLAGLPVPTDPNVLVGTATADDAAVYRIADDIAIVQTVDFFTPIVDDPRLFGAIAAANSLSDIYAMGARPLFGLNIVAFPDKRLSLDVLRAILEGALEKAAEAGVSVIGGHTIEDNEPKYGLAVTGVAHPDTVLRNSGAKPGDALVLTKPIGTGIIATAMKRGVAEPAVAGRAIEVMSALNRAAAEALDGFDAHACTDVTGFGLMGHLKEMTEGSGVDVEVWAAAVPVIPGVRELALADIIPGGTINNHEFVSPVMDWDEGLSRIDRMILCDAQTSGGLLVALPEDQAERYAASLRAAGLEAAVIGRVTGAGTGRISAKKQE
ncbi:MAG: selenide, water dikinase SelD [Candidatus Krumholzibacteriota bacterium]|nr:selenide, water dikinase SelD [Candidatus Krumholzibacteriota bacterium]